MKNKISGENDRRAFKICFLKRGTLNKDNRLQVDPGQSCLLYFKILCL